MSRPQISESLIGYWTAMLEPATATLTVAIGSASVRVREKVAGLLPPQPTSAV